MRNYIRINQPCIGKEELRAVEEVLSSGVLTDKNGMGPRVMEFERAFSKFIGVKHAIAVSSGTAALHAALLAVGVKAGDEVIVPSFTFSATAEAAVLCGAKPVFADIDPNSLTINADTVSRVLSNRTKAIMPVHLYGQPVDMAPILEIARERGIAVIEDAAQAHGASLGGKMVGGIGDMGCFSFYGAKNMTTGEGGIITTNDDDYAEALRAIRTHGESRPYWTVRLGHNYRMTEIAAAIGLVQLQKLPDMLERRRENAARLGEALSMVGKLSAPKGPDNGSNSWYVYTVRFVGANAGRRNKLVEKLRSKNIDAQVYYETPVHLMPFYMERFDLGMGALPETEKASRQVLSLPVHPMVTQDDIGYMADTIRKLIR
ncbi:MAG: DegT/DnrJ/EryC1/StrS family aminotransferase [Candidatus Bathyarchaeia archaeon]